MLRRSPCSASWRVEVAPIDLTGRTAIVTGAGGGLGRSHALLLAKRGAKVVVNDRGTDTTGRGQSSAAADAVVEMIRSEGGVAIADAHDIGSLEGATGVYQAAQQSFGQVDIVIHNAGFLRDATFGKASVDDFEALIRVHLLAPMYLSSLVYPGMRERRYGRMVYTSSVSGVYGNFSQAGYAAGKSGVTGFMHVLAMEGSSYNVYSNTIVPTVTSRLSEDLMPLFVSEAAKAEHVSAIVAYLCSDGCTVNGAVIAAGAGLYAGIMPIEAKGIHLDPYSKIEPEQVAAHINRIMDFSEPYWAHDLFGSCSRISDGLLYQSYQTAKQV